MKALFHVRCLWLLMKRAWCGCLSFEIILIVCILSVMYWLTDGVRTCFQLSCRILFWGGDTHLVAPVICAQLNFQWIKYFAESTEFHRCLLRNHRWRTTGFLRILRGIFCITTLVVHKRSKFLQTVTTVSICLNISHTPVTETCSSFLVVFCLIQSITFLPVCTCFCSCVINFFTLCFAKFATNRIL